MTSVRDRLRRESKARQKAEKQLTEVKRRTAQAREALEKEHANRDERNAHSLDKLHSMYDQQIQKLRSLLATETEQLAAAREEICELTMAVHRAAAEGGLVVISR